MDIPTRMKAIRKTKPEPGRGATELVEVAVPKPKSGEVLVKVLGSAVLVRSQKYPTKGRGLLCWSGARHFCCRPFKHFVGRILKYVLAFHCQFVGRCFKYGQRQAKTHGLALQSMVWDVSLDCRTRFENLRCF